MTGPGPNGAAAPTRRWRRAEMTDTTPTRGFRTRLSHAGRAGKRTHGFVNPPLLRGSTVLAPTVADRRAAGGAARRAGADLRRSAAARRTGRWRMRSPKIEGGTRCHIVCSGLAAVTTPLLACLNAGDHMPDAGPRLWADAKLRLGDAEASRHRDDVLSSGDRRGRHRGADAAEHQGRLYRKPRQPYVRGAGRAGDRPRGACARRPGSARC